MNEVDLKLPSCACLAYGDASPRMAMIQLIDSHERGYFESETELVARALGDCSIVMVGVVVSDWERDLTPWPDRHLSKRPEVGQGAEATLRVLTAEVCPALREKYGPIPLVLGGYSLAGLCALWAVRLTDAFAAVAAMSPSVWLQDWDRFSADRRPLVGYAYLSLGDREEHVKNSHFRLVGDRVRQEHETLETALGADSTTLVWNPGNHFQQSMERSAAGFAWCGQRLKDS